MANVKNNVTAQDTRRRLLEAAGEVFAERGFHAATIKQITDRARTSVAAVNYHFRDKAELYAAVLRRIEADAQAICPPERPDLDDPLERFRAMVRHVVVTMITRAGPTWQRVLMAREFAEMSPQMRSMLESVARPVNGRLSGVVAELVGLDADDPRVGYRVAGIIAQCVYYLHHHRHLSQLHAQLPDAPDVETLAEQVVEVALAGLRPPEKADRRTRRRKSAAAARRD